MVGGMIFKDGLTDQPFARCRLRLGQVLRLCARIMTWCLCWMAVGQSSAAAQNALAEIRQRGEIVFATEAAYPPFEFIENGKIQGFDIDLGNAIGQELGVRVRWKNMEWSGVLGSLENRLADAILSGMTITEERKQKGYGFSRPYFLSGQAIVRRKGDRAIRGPEDLKGRVIAVQIETTGQEAAEKLGLPPERIHKFKRLQDALLDVRNRRSDAAVGDLPALLDIIRKGYAAELEVAGDVFVQENVGIATRRGETELIAALNKALDAIITDGRYAQIFRRWIDPTFTTAHVAGLDRVKDQGTLVAAAATPPPSAASATSAQASGSAFGIRWPLLREALPWLLRGARMTLSLTLLALLIGIPVGLLIALARLSPFRPLSLVAMVYVEALRGTPLLMQIYVIYFVLPAFGVRVPEMVSAVTALSANAAAYIAEIFRAGIQSIDVGQMEAARALGMDYRGAMRWVILPQTMRRVLPPLTNEGVALLKDSSLVSVISIGELMMIGTQYATTTGSPTTIYLAVALFYLAMTLPLTYLVRRLEAQWQPVSRPRARGKAARHISAAG